MTELLFSYLALFLSAFISATLLPLNSELVLIALLKQNHPALALWLIGTIGNSLGSICNWALGRYFLAFQNKSWFPFKANKLERAQRWFERYGSWSLLFAWLPVFGDALTFIAGIMRVRLDLFTLLVVVGKGTRYALIIAFYFGVFD